MKKVLIISAIATPIVTLGVLIGVNSIQDTETRENIEVVKEVKQETQPVASPEPVVEVLEQEVTTTPVIEQEPVTEPVKQEKPDFTEVSKYVHEKLKTTLKTDLAKRHNLSIWNTIMSHYYGNPMLFSDANIDQTVKTCADHFNKMTTYEEFSSSLHFRNCGL